MNEKPEALRLIQHMDDNYADDWDGIAIRAELRRLHADNERRDAERDEAVKAEREACAKVCDGWALYGIPAAAAAAAAIRARGEVPR